MLSISSYIHSPRLLLLAIIKKTSFLYKDVIYLRMIYYLMVKKRLHLKNPVTFTEKIQWLKLYDRNPFYTTLVNKLTVKEYVKRKIGEAYVIPVLGVWNKAEDIDFKSLPNQFVLKVNCGGGNGNVYVCRDKKYFDYREICKSLNKGLKSGNAIYWVYREWPYKNVEPKIFAESFIEDPDSRDLTDYKFYCFNGVVKYCQVIKNRTTCETIDFYDTKWIKQPFSGINSLTWSASTSNIEMPKPLNYDKMIDIATVLSQGFPFLRVDLYNIKGVVYFGELTFYPASGLGFFTPDKYDTLLGELLNLPQAEKKN